VWFEVQTRNMSHVWQAVLRVKKRKQRITANRERDRDRIGWTKRACVILGSGEQSLSFV